MSDDLVILTGAPGTGKTAILGELGAETPCVAEPAREVLAEHRARHGQQEVPFARSAAMGT